MAHSSLVNRNLARSNRPPPVRRVMLVMNWYSHLYHRGIARYAKDARWTLDASTIHSGRSYIHTRVDGVIGLFTRPSPVLNQILKQQIPVVDLCRVLTKNRLSRVLADNEGMGHAVARHLLTRGFRHFAFACRNAKDWTAIERLRGFRDALRQENLDCAFFAASPSYQESDLRDDYLPRLVAWLEKQSTPFAIMAQNDDFAVQLLLACEMAGIEVPLQAAVVGCDNDELVCHYTRIPLSSIDSNMEGQGYEAARLLDRLMDGEPPPDEPIRVPHLELHIRQSSDVLAIDHRELTAALRIIWTTYPDPVLSVDQIADKVGLSRQGLDKACRKHLGRTISDELKQVRLQHAMSLLQNTNTKVSSVARECGYSRLKHLRDTILRETGSTPSQFRLKKKTPDSSRAARISTDAARHHPYSLAALKAS